MTKICNYYVSPIFLFQTLSFNFTSKFQELFELDIKFEVCRLVAIAINSSMIIRVRAVELESHFRIFFQVFNSRRFRCDSLIGFYKVSTDVIWCVRIFCRNQWRIPRGFPGGCWVYLIVSQLIQQCNLLQISVYRQ